MSSTLRRIWLLGSYRLGEGAKAQKLANLHMVSEATRVVEAAEGVQDDWPHAFFELLDATAARYGRTSSPLLTDHFGGFYKELFSPAFKAAFGDLRSAFEQYILQRWPGQLAARNRRLSAQTRDEHVWLPLTSAAKSMHWRTGRLRRVVERGIVRGHLQLRPSGRVSGVVHRDDVAALKKEADQWLDLTTVCKALHVGKAAAREMMARGVLVAVAGPSVDGHRVWQFRRQDVDSCRVGICASRLVG
jgi:hypothetical protein